MSIKFANSSVSNISFPAQSRPPISYSNCELNTDNLANIIFNCDIKFDGNEMKA